LGTLSDEPPRVVITGLGVVSPLGRGAESLWRGLLEGRSAVDVLSGLDTAGAGPYIGAQVRDYAPPADLPVRQAGLGPSLAGLSRSHLFAVDAALQALSNARLPIEAGTAGQVAVIAGTALGGDPSGPVAASLGAQGPSFTALAGAASGTWALGLGAAIIRRGQAKVAVCGGTEAPLTPEVLHDLDGRGFLSHRHDDPAGACRPFDVDRDGTVLGEGAAFLVLEERDLALSRGATIYAEVVGFGAAYQPASPAGGPAAAGEETTPGAGAPDPVLAGRTLQMALMEKPLLQGEIDLYWACASAIPEHDRLETAAVKRVFGGGAYRLTLTASKGATGHLLGASGALEAAACALALRNQSVPPTVNCEEPDPACDLDIVRGKPRQERLTHVMSYVFGPDLPAGQAGGHHACLILGAPGE
jgi:3-oxoacyl-[acyl-carrier-protein] synthase II